MKDPKKETKKVPCSDCNGTGTISIIDESTMTLKAIPCPTCDGTGKVPAK